MELPFTAEQFLGIFRRYNTAVWPAQIALLVAALATAFAALRAALNARWNSARLAFGILAAMWLWTGVVYHFRFFAGLTPAGRIFGSLFVAQAAILALSAWLPDPMFAPPVRPGVAAGSVLLLYALVLYPAINFAGGHRYPATPTFGAPCPLTLFTLGIFCLLPSMTPRVALVIPMLWSVLASVAAVRFGIGGDLALIPAAAIALMVVRFTGERIHRVRLHPT
jgi:hypothetical protein